MSTPDQSPPLPPVASAPTAVRPLGGVVTQPNLAGCKEVAQILGVSKQRVHQLRTKGAMPDPLTVLAAGPIWDRDEIERYAAERGRVGGAS